MAAPVNGDTCAAEKQPPASSAAAVAVAVGSGCCWAPEQVWGPVCLSASDTGVLVGTGVGTGVCVGGGVEVGGTQEYVSLLARVYS